MPGARSLVLSASAALGLAAGAQGASSPEQRAGAADELTLEQQVGQLIMLSFSGAATPDYVRDALRERRAAGAILFGRNIESREQLRELTSAQRRTGSRPLVATEQEGAPCGGCPGCRRLPRRARRRYRHGRARAIHP
jgi:hypothetical protein